MSRFLDPPKAGKPLAEDKVDKTYKAMRTKVFLGAFSATQPIILYVRIFRWQRRT